MRVDDIQCWPILIVESTPDHMLVVDGDRVGDLQAGHGGANVVVVFLKLKLGCVDPDHHQPVTLVFLSPGAPMRKRAQPVDAGIGPEIDQDDFSAKFRRRQGRRVKPRIRLLEGIQPGSSLSLGGGRRLEEGEPNQPLQVDPRLEAQQCERLAALRRDRDTSAVSAALSALRKAAEGTDNVLYPMRTALAALATTGEVSAALRDVWGRYLPADVF